SAGSGRVLGHRPRLSVLGFGVFPGRLRTRCPGGVNAAARRSRPDLFRAQAGRLFPARQPAPRHTLGRALAGKPRAGWPARPSAFGRPRRTPETMQMTSPRREGLGGVPVGLVVDLRGLRGTRGPGTFAVPGAFRGRDAPSDEDAPGQRVAERRSNSPSRAPARNASHSAAEKARTAPAGFFESRTAMPAPRGATSTHIPPAPL